MAAAHLGVAYQGSVAAPLNSDSLLHKPFLKTQKISFRDKPWMREPKSKIVPSRYQSVVSMIVPQAVNKAKVLVSPLDLEDAKEPPLNLHKPKEPYTATIVSVERLVGPKAPGETCHIVIDHGGNVPYWEGQSYGVVPPGENPKKPGAPHNVRLYSIASTRYGDSFDGKTASLCVRRAVYYDPETGKEDPSKNAPYRGYLRRMFMESVPKYKFNGLAWLFLGVANSDSLLYDDEFSKYLVDYPDNFRYDRALSREQKNKNGGKMYVQDKIEEYSDEIFRMLDGGAHIYFCGLKGMMPGIQETLKRVAVERGESWDAKLSQLKRNKQWHVEYMIFTAESKQVLMLGWVKWLSGWDNYQTWCAT
ncbi:Ferredoxin-NADP+ reductase [Cynara cardunculus var. scolymus]|uniref:ferredoxin--NADP(+) reductase n=1 Tax=Cynara cardunculus var. scolymus TaxID=59895 RepID=A0A103YFL1_CYNCS|nr:Ferredoxin-NADP+ reductase [Cynara cardunculus var. scolymus]